MSAKLPKYTNYFLFAFLVVINIALRYPFTPHQGGGDVFNINFMATSITKEGCAKWIIHPASYAGMYPYSYPSSVPFLFSMISQATGLNMEWTVWLSSTIFGVLSALA